jgi:hypothetical protein
MIVFLAKKRYGKGRRTAMDDFNNRSNMDPITYAVVAGDISRGASPTDLPGRFGNLRHPEEYLIYGGKPSKGSSLIALALSIAFLLVAILSW